MNNKLPLKNLSFDDAIFQHELDVAGLEISDKRKQLENMKRWLSEVKPSEQNQVHNLLKKIEQKGLVK